MGIKGLVYGLAVFIILIIPAAANAATGVGVNTGKIILNEPLAADTTYSLPSMMVYNTGDETGEYEMAVTFNEKQPELKPAASWVSFSPKHFTLAPLAAQQVTMTITLPSNVKSGDYYAYLEAHGVATANAGVTSVTAAAAAKFYFSAIGNPTPPPAPEPVKKPQKSEPKPAERNILSSNLSQFEPYMKQITNSNLSL